MRPAKPLLLVCVLMFAAAATASANPVADLPVPVQDPATVQQIDGGPCTYENDYEKTMWTQGRYKDCERIRFVYGPIPVRPGQNDGIIGPVTIEKPSYPGAIVRFKPDLVDATGKAPGIENVHLHHGTWLGGDGNGPVFAAGEEKTIFHFPDGYGMYTSNTSSGAPANNSDTWLLLFMIHNAVAAPTNVWVTWDMDYVPVASAQAAGIKHVRPIWLDVMAGDLNSPERINTSSNPVFNVQKGFGSYNEEFGRMACEYPRQNCARFDVYGGVTGQQGKPLSNVPGTDVTIGDNLLPAGVNEGTIVQWGGHLHPGGLRDRVSLVRNLGTPQQPNWVEKDVLHSDGLYWDRDAPKKAGGPVDTWDFSMTTTGAQIGYKLAVKRGDKLRINALIDSEISWYENMGIVMGLITPGPDANALDPFAANAEFRPGIPTQAITPEGGPQETCTNDVANGVLCLNGQVTHGHLPEAGVFGGTGERPLPAKRGRLISEIHSTAFTFGEADMALWETAGIPQVKINKPLRFYNPDTAADIWHTFTRCKEPCNGAYGLNYPSANGGKGPDDLMDFDSTEIGYGLFVSPASSQISPSGPNRPFNKPPREFVEDGLFYDFTPTALGTYTFWCRIHPGMRGAFEVIA